MDIFKAYRYCNCHCLQKTSTQENAAQQRNFLITFENICIHLLQGFQWNGQVFYHFACILKRWAFYPYFFEVEEMINSCQRRHMCTHSIKIIFSQLVVGQNAFKYFKLYCRQMQISPTMKPGRAPQQLICNLTGERPSTLILTSHERLLSLNLHRN